MGILNVTPDSFSDGGLHFSLGDAVDAGRRMIEEGADLIDVGGESTRPGSESVDAVEEMRRTIPVIENLVRSGASVSIDTMKPEVARAAIQAGAFLVNDVSGFRDPKMVEVVSEHLPHVCTMHMGGEPRTMQQNPNYEDVVSEVRSFLCQRADELASLGLSPHQVWIDPGIGFGKTVDHNLTLLKRLQEFTATPYPVLIGTSRKSFLGKLLGTLDKPLAVEDRLEATLATQSWAQIQGARIIRSHDVLAARRVIDIISAIQNRP